MTIFEEELRKCTTSFTDKQMIGRSMYIPLNNNIRLKLHFFNTGHAHLAGIQLSILDIVDGVIDSANLRFKDIWGMKIETSTGPSEPYIWTYNGKSEWNGYKPTMQDFRLIENQVVAYAKLFTVQEQTYTQTPQIGGY